VSIGTLSVVEHHVQIRDGVRIHSQVFVPEFTRLEAGAWLGPGVVLTNARYPRHPDAKNKLQGPLIGRDAKVGANTTVLPGLTIGDGALIGAGSLVAADVPAGMLAYGTPAVVRGSAGY
jgi:acetyltransferase-like isoleucine patch superfamily enzyme